MIPVSIRCQCGYCRHIMDVPLTVSGRKILCPLCGDPMIVPAPGAKIVFEKFVLSQSLDRFRFSDWDKALTRHILDSKRMNDAALYGAICDFSKAQRRKSDLSLSEHLETAGAISKTDRDSMREALRGTVKTTDVEFVSCPNCFARVDGRLRACKFCGQRLSDPAFATCPACKHEQKKGPARCEHCGANLATGLKEKTRPCPACGGIVVGDPKNCPHCRAVVKTSRERHEEEQGAFARKRRRFAIAAAAAVVGILLLGLGWSVIRTAFRASHVGYAQAALEDRLNRFAEILRKNDIEPLRPFLSEGTRTLGGPECLKIICTGRTDGMDVISVRSVTVSGIEIEKDNLSASVTADVKAVFRESNDEAGNIFKEVKTHVVKWRWVVERGAWVCEVR